MSLLRCLSPIATCLVLLGTAHAADLAVTEAPSDRPDEQAAEPVKPSSSEASPARPAEKETKRRPGFRIKLPAEMEP